MNTRKFQFPIILLSLSTGFLAFILPIYSKQMNMTALEIGGLFSIISLVNLILRPIIGHGIDKYGRKIFLLIASIIYFIAMIFYAYSNTSVLLYIAKATNAIASSILAITLYSISIDLSKDTDTGYKLGVFDGAMNRGAFYGALFGFSVLSTLPFLLGWQAVFLSYGVAAFFSMIYIYKYIPETKRINNDLEVIKVDIEKNKKIRIIILIMIFLSTMVSSMINPIFLIYLQDNITKDIGLLASAYIPAAIIYSMFPAKAGKYIDRFGPKRTWMIGIILANLMLYMIIFTHSIEFLILLWSLEAIGITLSSIASRTIIRDITGVVRIGREYSIFLVVGSIGGIIGPLFGGYVYQTFSQYFPFYINIIVRFINLLLIIIFIPKQKVKRMV